MIIAKITKGLSPVIGHHAGIPLFGKPLSYKGRDHLLVINDEYPVYHELPPILGNGLGWSPRLLLLR